MRIGDLIQCYQKRNTQLLQRICNEVLNIAVFVTAHFDSNALVHCAIGGNIEVAARHFVDGCAQSRGQADNFLNAIVFNVIEDKNTFDRHSRTRGLGNRITTGDEFMPLGDLDGGFRASACNCGFLGLANFTRFLTLKRGMVGAVFGLGGWPLTFEATARVTTGADLRALLRARLPYGAATSIISSHRVSLFLRELTQAYGVRYASGRLGRALIGFAPTCSSPPRTGRIIQGSRLLRLFHRQPEHRLRPVDHGFDRQ